MIRRTSILTGGRRSDRAMTLLEILVSVGVMVAILGIAYGMVIESERSSQKIDQRETAMVYCQRVIDRVSTVLRAAVPPVDLAVGTTPVEPVFEANRLSVMMLDRETTGGLARVSIALEPAGRNGAGTIQYRREPAGGGTQGVSQDDFFEALPKDAKVGLEFGYAGMQAPEALASYQPTWPADGWPTLVRIRVNVTTGEEPGNTVELETAVIPSMIPHSVRPAANPEATSTPTSGTVQTTGTATLDTPTTSGPEVTQ